MTKKAESNWFNDGIKIPKFLIQIVGMVLSGSVGLVAALVLMYVGDFKDGLKDVAGELKTLSTAASSLDKTVAVMQNDLKYIRRDIDQIASRNVPSSAGATH